MADAIAKAEIRSSSDSSTSTVVGLCRPVVQRRSWECSDRRSTPPIARRASGVSERRGGVAGHSSVGVHPPRRHLCIRRPRRAPGAWFLTSLTIVLHSSREDRTGYRCILDWRRLERDATEGSSTRTGGSWRSSPRTTPRRGRCLATEDLRHAFRWHDRNASTRANVISCSTRSSHGPRRKISSTSIRRGRSAGRRSASPTSTGQASTSFGSFGRPRLVTNGRQSC